MTTPLEHRFTGSAPWARCIFCGLGREKADSPTCEKAIDEHTLRTNKDFKEWNRTINTAIGSFKKKTLVAKSAPQCQQ